MSHLYMYKPINWPETKAITFIDWIYDSRVGRVTRDEGLRSGSINSMKEMGNVI